MKDESELIDVQSVLSFQALNVLELLANGVNCANRCNHDQTSPSNIVVSEKLLIDLVVPILPSSTYNARIITVL